MSRTARFTAAVRRPLVRKFGRAALTPAPPKVALTPCLASEAQLELSSFIAAAQLARPLARCKQHATATQARASLLLTVVVVQLHEIDGWNGAGI